jgi:hypothetical protein
MRKQLGGNRRWVALALLAGLALGAVTITPALGGGLFTKQKAKGLFYTKAASDSRFLTPGSADARYLTPGSADGRYLTPASADGRYLPRSASTQIQVGTDAFESSLPGVIFRFTGSTQLRATPPASALFNAPLTVPSVLQGQPTRLDSVVLCYAASATATIDTVTVDKATSVNGPGTDSQLVTDDTDRSDTACRTYAPASPAPIGPNDMLTFVVKGNFTGSPNFITVTRLTVNLSD